MSDSKGASGKKIGDGDVYEQYMKMKKEQKGGVQEDEEDDDGDVSLDTD